MELIIIVLVLETTNRNKKSSTSIMLRRIKFLHWQNFIICIDYLSVIKAVKPFIFTKTSVKCDMYFIFTLFDCLNKLKKILIVR
jgi:hypothetical protein